MDTPKTPTPGAAGHGGAFDRLRRARRPMLLAAAALTIAGYFLSSWSITLLAPQYPQGLTVHIRGIGLSGNVSEVDELNHYIGMMRLEELAKPERALWPWGIALLVAVLVTAAFLRGRPAAVLALGAVVYPIVFAADLYMWLDYSGHHLDPHAALSSSVAPFMPAFIGSKMVGQFQTTASFGAGYLLDLLAAVLAAVAAVTAWRRVRPE